MDRGGDRSRTQVYNQKPGYETHGLDEGRGLMMARNVRIGLLLFFIYLALYVAFVLLAAFSPASMETTPFGGLNVAILYGFGLIVAAILVALLYGWTCRESASESNEVVRARDEA